ncbi:SpoIIE family protein phosphatase [Flexithrix dorotheae]|uniref:SpoIIE family protein phosphatase n=1 Tax=Flexithrix dorotheae TaxID=70993 RepID=UPI00036A3AE2|nr:SpoIIE family protein phosphatase [Flexithrix dorotheae]
MRNSFLFLLAITISHFFPISQTFSQDKVEITGIVIDENGKTVPDVKISINENSYVTSDAAGVFSTEISSSKIDEIEAFKRGFEMFSWGKLKGDNFKIEIKLKPVDFNLIGKVFDENEELLANADIVLNPDDPQLKAKSNSKGVFSFKVPAFIRVDETSKFSVNGKLLEPEGVEFQKKGGLLHLTLPVPYQTIVIYDKDNNKLTHTSFTINGKEYETNDQGEYKLRIREVEKQQYAINGHEVISSKHLPGDNHYLLYFSNIKEEKEELSNVEYPEGSDEIVEEVEVEDDKIDLEKITEYDKDINIIINDLELEKQRLLQKSTEIRTQMELVAEKMGEESELTDEEKKHLTETMTSLETQLIENDLAYEDAQVKTKEIIDKMKFVIIEKDSVNHAVEEQIEVIATEKKQVEEELERDFIIFSVVAISLLIVALILFGSGKRIKKKNNELFKLNTELSQTKDDLLEKVQEINQQKEEIAVQAENLQELNRDVTIKNKKITDSIRYAKSVQEAVLPSLNLLDSFLSNYFITYLPKDIVSGDFYWFTKVPPHNGEGEKILIAAVDCTGHGVSGAFMSMVGNTLLEEIVNQMKIYDTSEILEHLNKRIIEGLRQNETTNRDGMDICICSLEKLTTGNTKVTFTGAKRPLFIHRNNEKIVETLAGDRRSIAGRQPKVSIEFSKQEIELSPKDVIYLTTDGLVDQNNENRKRFGTNRLKDFILENSGFDKDTQKKNLEQKLKEYQGKTEQRDDILVIGITV